MNRLDGKVAFISGAARGIGAATARLMVEAGATVAIGDVLDERGRETARAIAGAGEAAIYLHLDVTREEDWNAAVAAAIELSETVRLDKITAVNTASETKVAIGAKASKTPNAVATPFPP